MKKMSRMCVIIILSFILFLPQGMIQVNAEEQILRIMATSDIHNRFVAYDYATNGALTRGGFSRVASVIEKNRTENTLLIDNGDTIQGNSSFLFNKDEVQPMVKALNIMNYDTYTAGNHEFNYGMDYFGQLQKSFSGAFLTANVYKGDPIPENRVAKNYTIVEKNGIKTAVIGVVTPHIKRWDAANLEGYTVTNPYDEVKSAVAEIQAKQLSDVIAVSFHASIDGEYGNDSAKELAKLVPEIDVIIAGHAHETRIEYTEDQTVIIEPGSYGSSVSLIDIPLVKKDGAYSVNRKLMQASNISVDSKVSELLLVTEHLAAEHARAKEDASTVIGKLRGGNLVPENEIQGIPQSQLQDTAFIDLILDTQLEVAGKAIGTLPENVHHVSSAAIFNTTTNVREGQITKADVSKIYQFDNTLETISINGAMLKKFMEANMQYYNTFKQGDLTISFNEQVRAYNYDIFQGVSYDVNIAKPVGERVESLVYTDTKQLVLDTDTIYLTVNNYRASGLRNTYPEFQTAPRIYESTGRSVDLIRDMIAQKIIKKKEIEPTFNQNWKIVHPPVSALDYALVVKLVREGQLKVPVSQDGRTPNVRSITETDLNVHKNTVIATTDAFTNNNRNDTTPLGYMVSTLIQKEMQTDVVILKKDDLKAPWSTGDVTYNTIYTSIPANQSIGVYTITEKQLKRLLNDAISPDQLNVEYRGLRIEARKEKGKIHIAKIVKEDNTPLPKQMTIALTADIANRYQLTLKENTSMLLQDVLIKQVQMQKHIQNSYQDYYSVKVKGEEKPTYQEKIIQVILFLQTLFARLFY